jgi:AhpD family alkylhydroperoxidase
MNERTTKDPYELFEQELPTLAERFSALVDAQIALEGLDAKTKQLMNIAIQTANRNVRGVMWHALMARKQGASREEIVGAVAMNLHLTGLASVLDALPAAIQGVEMAEEGGLPEHLQR